MTLNEYKDAIAALTAEITDKRGQLKELQLGCVLCELPDGVRDGSIVRAHIGDGKAAECVVGQLELVYESYGEGYGVRIHPELKGQPGVFSKQGRRLPYGKPLGEAIVGKL